ncbi:molybdate transport repressor ModE-like protein [Crossiella equi]|uniref:Molybdate transport repressor ModE-like protein n=1 Tax=Crossiella equi TaxID=130796 RepID=A0ABS5AK22_9PSEU|nr:LysR family transcriptional regulator [Crossiella equi]MBP2476918.1 molybdate transport repressor ModE-like protein [Crossiella equi]
MSTRPDTESLALLVLLGETGSLGQAAARLGISQPAASKRLATLERRLGLSLVERDTTGSRLTEAGRMVSGWAERVLAELDVLLHGVEALREQRAGQLSVAASMTVAEHLVPGWITELRRAEPGLHIGLQVTNSTAVGGLVVRGAVDLGFVEGPAVPRGLRTRLVAADRLAVVVAPSHPWAKRRRPVGPADLAGTPLVVRERGSGTRETLEAALERAGSVKVQALVELGSTTAVRGAVAAGSGPAVLSVLAVEADLLAGRLTEVPVTGVDLRRRLRAVWVAGRVLSPPAAALLAVAARTPRPVR